MPLPAAHYAARLCHVAGVGRLPQWLKAQLALGLQTLARPRRPRLRRAARISRRLALTPGATQPPAWPRGRGRRLGGRRRGCCVGEGGVGRPQHSTVATCFRFFLLSHTLTVWRAPPPPGRPTAPAASRCTVGYWGERGRVCERAPPKNRRDIADRQCPRSSPLHPRAPRDPHHPRPTHTAHSQPHAKKRTTHVVKHGAGGPASVGKLGTRRRRAAPHRRLARRQQAAEQHLQKQAGRGGREGVHCVCLFLFNGGEECAFSLFGCVDRSPRAAHPHHHQSQRVLSPPPV